MVSLMGHSSLKTPINRTHVSYSESAMRHLDQEMPTDKCNSLKFHPPSPTPHFIILNTLTWGSSWPYSISNSHRNSLTSILDYMDINRTSPLCAVKPNEGPREILPEDQGQDSSATKPAVMPGESVEIPTMKHSWVLLSLKHQFILVPSCGAMPR